MEYRAVGNRCAVNISSLKLFIPESEVMDILVKEGFRQIEVDIIAIARQCIGVSRYKRGAQPSKAPGVVDCSSFVKWLYSQKGIWLPRRSIQQRELGEEVDISEIAKGDVVFVSGRINYYYKDPADGVGHVGIATGEGTIVHAANSKRNVVESPLEGFFDAENFRGARRYVPKNSSVITLVTPLAREVEIAGDIGWIVLQSIPT